jgi:hypothetical protein
VKDYSGKSTTKQGCLLSLLPITIVLQVTAREISPDFISRMDFYNIFLVVVLEFKLRA